MRDRRVTIFFVGGLGDDLLVGDVVESMTQMDAGALISGGNDELRGGGGADRLYGDAQQDANAFGDDQV